MITILKNILNFITDPKNTRMIMLGIIVLLLFLFLRQCGKTKTAKQEAVRISNNYKAAKDTLRQYAVGDSTWRAEKLGFEITINELKNEYAELFEDFEFEKNKPPKTIIKIEHVIIEHIDSIPVYLGVDSSGNKYMNFKDSTKHNKNNYRMINGKIYYDIILDEIDSIYKLKTKNAELNFELGMNLNLGLFQDKKTKEISIIAETDYPGVKFTNLNGANIMDDPSSKKILKNARKNWGIGINAGYGFLINTNSGIINTGPYIGFGVNYSPKFLQW